MGDLPPAFGSEWQRGQFMTASRRVLTGGLVPIDPVSSAVQRVIALQYNPHSLNRSSRCRPREARAGIAARRWA
jgi:hypothetical protein